MRKEGCDGSRMVRVVAGDRLVRSNGMTTPIPPRSLTPGSSITPPETISDNNNPPSQQRKKRVVLEKIPKRGFLVYAAAANFAVHSCDTRCASARFVL